MSNVIDTRRLFSDYASGEISNEELQDLEAALRADADLRREFIEYMNIDSALGDLAALSKAEVAEIEAATQEDKSGTLVVGDSASPAPLVVEIARTYRVAVITGGVAASLLLAVILWVAYPAATMEMPVATLVSSVDAALICEGRPHSGTDLTAGQYRLERGLLHLRFAGGVMVYVEAPTRFDAVSGKRVVLQSGRLSASVLPEALGFTVETPEAEVIDFGTEFSVEVDAGTSEVHVFDGLVRVQPRAKKDGTIGEGFDLRTSQAVKIEGTAEKPVKIELATDRFIRTFDESPRRYSRTVKRLSPVAFYRMAIRDQGLACLPPQYSGVVLTGDGIRPPHARGVFAGGSLRVLAESAGRGGRVDTSPPLRTGQFTLAAFVYLESGARNGIVATNIRNNDGSFCLRLDENGVLQATIRNNDGDLLSVSGDTVVALHTWRHVVVTVDGRQFRLYEDGHLIASAPCPPLADSETNVLWFGTDAEGLNLWEGRIDEVALFDRSLSDAEVTELYQMALEEMENSE